MFLCDITPEIAFKRNAKRNNSQDEFDKLSSLIEYHSLYEKAAEFVSKHNLTKVIRIDTNKSISEVLKNVEEILKDI